MTRARLVYHIVLCTHKRQRFISSSLEAELYAVIRATFLEQGAKFCYLNGVEDHIHILVCTNTLTSLCEQIDEVRQRSETFMKSHEPGFLWQRGYAVHSANPFDFKKLLEYVRDQKQRHARKMLWENYEVP